MGPPSGGTSLGLQAPSWGCPRTPHHFPWCLLIALTPWPWSPASGATPWPPSLGRPPWGLLTTHRAHSASPQQLGQFGEENKHFLPPLGLAAPQWPASSGFPGL